MEAVYGLDTDLHLPVEDHFEDFYLDHTTAQYLAQLLGPYGMALQGTPSVASLLAWVDTVYPPTLAASTKRHIIRVASDRPTETLTPVTTMAIKALTGAILSVANRLSYGSAIMPWEVKKAIVSTPQLQAMFHLDTTNTLPVTVQLDDKRFEHALSQDFVAGLQDYYWAAGARITVFIAGEVLQHQSDLHEANFIDDRAHFIVGLAATDEYGDDWPPEDRAFDTRDYLTGMATAAQWLGEDFHTRVSDLRYIDEQGQTHALTL